MWVRFLVELFSLATLKAALRRWIPQCLKTCKAKKRVESGNRSISLDSPYLSHHIQEQQRKKGYIMTYKYENVNINYEESFISKYKKSKTNINHSSICIHKKSKQKWTLFQNNKVNFTLPIKIRITDKLLERDNAIQT